MPRIFISYRRSDSGTFTGRIHDQLKASFGVNSVFRDVYNIPAGSDFRAVLNEEVAGTDVCLVIIGPQWLTITDAQGKRRLDDPNDFVRIEVEAALGNSRTRVVPVLVDNAAMPTAEQLPASMAELAYRNAVKVRTDPDFPRDMENLISQLKGTKEKRTMRSLWLLLSTLLLLVAGFFLFSPKNGSKTEIPTIHPSNTVMATLQPSEPVIATNRPSETVTPTVEMPTPTPLIEPVEPGEIMILVAQIEPIGAQQRDVTRFIVDDLVQRFETEKLADNIRIRVLGDVVKSATQAQNMADQTGAVLVLWGQYDDEAATLNLQLGSVESLPSLVIERDTLERIINVRLRVKDERQETLAHPILSALTFLANAENDFVENMRLILSLNQLNAPKPEILGNSVASHTYNASQVFITDPQTAASEITQGINMDATNPLLYLFRALVYQELGNFPLSGQDSDTAIRLAPRDWVVPYYVRGDESLITNDLESGIKAFTRVIAERPNDWFPYNMRGYLYFRAQRYDEARADIEKSIALGPEAEWPYMWATLIALRQGRLDDASTNMGNLMSFQSTNPMFPLLLMSALFGDDNAKLLGYTTAAIGHLSIGQFNVAVQDTDAVLSVVPNYAEMYLLKGLSYCNSDDYQKAEEAYSTGLTIDPTFTMLHFLRAEVRGRLGDATGAMDDMTIVTQSDISANLLPFIQAANAGQFSCKNITAGK